MPIMDSKSGKGDRMGSLLDIKYNARTNSNRWKACLYSLLLSAVLVSCNQGTTPTQTPMPNATTPTIAQATANAIIAPTFTITSIPTAQATSTSGATATPAVTSKPVKCPGAPDIHLEIGDWAMVSIDPPLPNKVRKEPNRSSELIGQVQPGENVLIVDGPACADGYAWWFIHDLAGLEGWTVEGDAEGYWLVNPISAWYPLPKPLTARGIKTYDLRELSISADTALVSDISGGYAPLATPLPTPLTYETPYPDDPRGNIWELGTVTHAAQSYYGVKSPIGGDLFIFELEDPLSRYYINNMSYDDCTQALRKTLENTEIPAAYLDPFCGVSVGIPIHFIVDVTPIAFTGGKGVRFLIASGNYQTVNKLYYVFEGLSDDGRYYLRARFSSIVHPYIIDPVLLQKGFGHLLAWEEGQYDEAQKSYDLFNSRIGKLLDARVVTLYPSLDFLDKMLASMVIK